VSRPTARRRARELALRILYQSEINEEPISEVVRAVMADFRGPDSVRRFASALVEAVESRRDDIDSLIESTSENWALARMASTDRNVLRSAVAELLVFETTEARVIIDEAVSIAARYGTDDSGRFVNGILDRLARQIRSSEFQGT